MGFNIIIMMIYQIKKDLFWSIELHLFYFNNRNEQIIINVNKPKHE